MNLFNRIKKQLIENGRSQEQLLILELTADEIRMDIYQHGELSSRIIGLQLNINVDGIDAYFNELVRVLRSELLWRVEDAAELVFLLPEEWCYVDRREMPALDKRELERALEWELEQYVPWPRNNYYYDTRCLGDEKNTYLVAAAPQVIVEQLLQAGEALAVTIKEITTAVSVDGYLAGKLHPNLLPPKYKRQLKYHKDIRVAELVFAMAVVISVALTVAALGWRYWNQENVNRLQGELRSLSSWEERMEWAEAAQRRLNHLQRITGLLDKDKRPLLPQLELWGQTAGDGCWLERIEASQRSGELILHGRGMDAEAITAFVNKLKSSGLYKSVELKEIKTDSSDTYVGFDVRLMLKEGAK